MPKKPTTKKTAQKTTERELAEGQQIFTTEEAMVYLRVSRSTLYRMVQAGNLKYYKLPRGGKRFKRDDLDAILIPGKPEEIVEEEEEET